MSGNLLDAAKAARNIPGSQTQIVQTMIKEGTEKEKRITNMSNIVKNHKNIKSTEPKIGEIKWIGDILYQYTANGWEVFQ